MRPSRGTLQEDAYLHWVLPSRPFWLADIVYKARVPKNLFLLGGGPCSKIRVYDFNSCRTNSRKRAISSGFLSTADVPAIGTWSWPVMTTILVAKESDRERWWSRNSHPFMTGISRSSTISRAAAARVVSWSIAWRPLAASNTRYPWCARISASISRPTESSSTTKTRGLGEVKSPGDLLSGFTWAASRYW
jgi:hypothetical protein